MAGLTLGFAGVLTAIGVEDGGCVFAIEDEITAGAAGAFRSVGLSVEIVAGAGGAAVRRGGCEEIFAGAAGAAMRLGGPLEMVAGAAGAAMLVGIVLGIDARWTVVVRRCCVWAD